MNGSRTAPPAETTRRLRVLVVDDHDVVHWGFRAMLGRLPWVERTLSAHTPQEALALAERYRPHVAVVDLHVAGQPGLDLARRLACLPFRPRVLLTAGSGGISPAAARAAGAAGLVNKSLPADQLAAAVLRAGAGLTVFPAAGADAAPGLSAREHAVLQLVATGATNREIAGELFLSPHTVKEHTSALYRKLAVRNRAQAVRRAASLGLLE